MEQIPNEGREMSFEEAIEMLLQQARDAGVNPEMTSVEVRDISSKAKARHDGDCTFYGRTMICTCGLLHRLIRKSSGQDYEDHLPAITMHQSNIWKLEDILRKEN